MSHLTVTWGQCTSPLNVLRVRIWSDSHPDFSTLPFLSVLVSVDPSELAAPLLDTKGTVACNAEVTDDRNCWVAPSYRSKAIWYAINVWSFCYIEEKNKSVDFPEEAVELQGSVVKWPGTGHRHMGIPCQAELVHSKMALVVLKESHVVHNRAVQDFLLHLLHKIVKQSHYCQTCI